MLWESHTPDLMSCWSQKMMMKMNRLHLVHQSLPQELVKCSFWSELVWLGKIWAAAFGLVEGLLERSEGGESRRWFREWLFSSTCLPCTWPPSRTDINQGILLKEQTWPHIISWVKLHWFFVMSLFGMALQIKIKLAGLLPSHKCDRLWYAAPLWSGGFLHLHTGRCYATDVSCTCTHVDATQLMFLALSMLRMGCKVYRGCVWGGGVLVFGWVGGGGWGWGGWDVNVRCTCTHLDATQLIVVTCTCTHVDATQLMFFV